MEDVAMRSHTLVREIPEGTEESIKLGESASLVLRNDGANSCTAILQIGQNKVYLRDLVPGHKIQLRLGTSFTSDFSDPPVVGINVPELRKDPKRIISLFHEIGHAVIRTKMNAEAIKELEQGTRKMLDVVERIMYLPEQVRSNLSLRQRALIIQDERAAWANALRIMRRLKATDGKTLLDLFDGANELREKIRVRLSTYESLLLDDSLPKTALADVLGKDEVPPQE